MEFFLLLGDVTAACIALWQAIAAHGGLVDIPWLSFLRRPRQIGGVGEVLFNFACIGLWVLIVLGCSHGVARLTVELRPAMAYVTSAFGYEIANTPGATLFFMSVGTSLYLTLGTAHTCHRLKLSPPTGLIEGLNPRMSPMLAARYWRTQGLLQFLLFIVTAVLVPLYRYFLDRGGILANGSIRLIIRRFGAAPILQHCDEARTLDDSETRFAELLDHVSLPISEHLRVYAMATELFKRHGFGGACARLAQVSGRDYHREAERFDVGQDAIIDLGCRRSCTVANACKDGSGLCVKIPKGEEDWSLIGEWLLVGRKVVIECRGKRFDLTIVRKQLGEREITLGLRTPEIRESRRALLQSLRPASARRREMHAGTEN